MTKLVKLVKAVSGVLDTVTLPVHYALNRSTVRARKLNVVRAKQVNPDDPYSPWVSATRTHVATILDTCDTVDNLMRRAVAAYGDRPCMGTRAVLAVDQDGRKKLANKMDWKTFHDIDREIDNLVAGFSDIGIKQGDRVAILMETRYEWMVACQAILRMGANVATLNSTLGEEGLIYALKELESRTVITSNSLLNKLEFILPQCPVTNVILVRDNIAGQPTPVPKGLGDKIVLFMYDHISLPTEKTKNRPKLSKTLNKPSDISCIMYTSGSTGIPKGVLVSHSNLVKGLRLNIEAARQVGYRNNVNYIAYLPLAHVFELGVEMLCLALGDPIAYASAMTLTDGASGLMEGSRGDFAVAQPEMMAAVPLILERMRKLIDEKIHSRGGDTAIQLFRFIVEYKNKWNALGYSTPLIDALVVKKFRSILGGKVNLMIAGGAALSLDTHAFCKAVFGITLSQGWGATELTGTSNIMETTDHSVGRCGGPLPDVRVKLRDWTEGGYLATDKPHPRGELIVGGPHVTMGYFKRDKETQECFFEEDGTRWFITGDIGEIYPDGTLKIIDRRKDLVKLQNGEFLSLGKIEAELKGSILVENICVVADSNQSFCVALITPNHAALDGLIKRYNLHITDKFSSPELNEIVYQEIVAYAKQHKLVNSEIPARIKLCKEEWTPANNLVTAALKVRRKQVNDFYNEDIIKLYEHKPPQIE